MLFVTIMTMNYYSYSAFKVIEKELKEKIVGCRINNITVINSHDFLCSLSMVKEEKLLVSLNHQHPFICLLDITSSNPTITGNLNENLRKYLREAFILSVDLIPNERILHFVLQKTNDYYDIEKRHLYLEFISQRANLVITDDQLKIIFALHYSPLTSARAILNNLLYSLPEAINLTPEEAPTLASLKINAQQYYKSAIEKHKKEKFLPLFRFIKSRIKALKRKIDILNREIDHAKLHLNDVDHGNMILALQNDYENMSAYLKNNNIVLDENLSLVGNANAFFKKYKKSKKTLEVANREIEKANQESNYLSYLLSSSNYMDDEDLLAITQELMPKKISKKKISSVKYGVVSFHNTKILFGKNAASNNELTFKVASRNDYFLHIKDYQGAHVIIKNANPDEESKLVAAEICLILSNKTAGEVMIAPMSNVKKGHALGEANLLNYQLIVLKQVRTSTIALLNKSR
jgi:predicted ribosome quality control (RQC) complex YloA/Tae2 family protein